MEMIGSMEEVAQGQRSKLAAERAAADRAVGVTLWLLVGSSTAAFVTGAAALLMLVLSVVRPLDLLRASVRAIGSGDLDARARVSGPEEVASLARDFNEMITDRRRVEEALRESAQRLHAIVTNAPLILFVLDREGVYTLHEGEGLAAVGLQPGQLVGRSVFDMYPDVPEVAENVRRALAGEALTATMAGRGFVFETHYAPVRNQDGEISGVIGVAVDTTERRRAEDVLQKAREELGK